MTGRETRHLPLVINSSNTSAIKVKRWGTEHLCYFTCWKLHSRKVTRYIRFLVTFLPFPFPRSGRARLIFISVPCVEDACSYFETTFCRLVAVSICTISIHGKRKIELISCLSNFETSLRIFTVNKTHPIMDKTSLKLYHPFVSQYLTC